MQTAGHFSSNRLPTLCRWIALVMLVGAGACESSTSKPGLDGTQQTDLARADGGARRDTSAAVADSQGPDACTPQPPDCTGLCGPVADRCTGEYTFCGECEGDHVCNMETHTCVLPLVTCKDLFAECGTIKNSCGKRLWCGECAAGKECDADTNTCVDCKGATCQDLGYACGQAWLGCGPSSAKTDCGACTGENKTCNPYYNLCENTCTPGSPAEVCAAAKASRGVECGQISDGCGGIVDCGKCQAPGKECGVRGVANRCDYPEIPDECKARGRQCGPLKSVCGGGTLDCGSCTAPEVCNENGVCGPPCTPKTCAADFADKCGSNLDDGCSGKLGCQCAESGKICNTKVPGEAGTCVNGSTCDAYTTRAAGQPCSNGASPAFPKGNGDNLVCQCNSSLFCVKDGRAVTGATAGTCCQNTAPSCSSGVCKVTNTCTGQVTNCCNSNQYCDSVSNTCKSRKQCSAYTDGKEGHPCSNEAAFDDGSGQLTLTCPCTEPGSVCVVPSGEKIGTCCINRNVCDGTSCTVVDSCTGRTVNCCTGNQCCDTDTNRCKAARQCTYYTDGSEGARCSASPFFDNDCGGQLTCRCVEGVCIVPGGMQEGTCCVNTATCNGTCTVTDTCTGQAIQCCNGNQFCNASNTCENKKACGDYTNGENGSPCSTTPLFEEGGGGLLTCGCDGSGVCLGQSGSTPGSCCFNTATCDGSSCTVTNTCTSATINCCTPIQHCEHNKCVATTCGTYDANGAIGDPCSTVASSAFPLGNGTNLTCNCSTAGSRFNNKCVGSSATKAGTCQCTPDACNGRTGVFDDGCGGKINCTG